MSLADPIAAPALHALLDPANTDTPDLQRIEFECLQLRYGTELVGELGGYADASKAAATYHGYNRQLLEMKRYAQDHGLRAFPPTPEFLVKYIASRAERGLTYNSVCAPLAPCEAVAKALNAGVGASRDYLVRRVVRGVGRLHGRDAVNAKRAWIPDYTRAALPHFEALSYVRPLHAARNLSMLTFGGATAARRASYRTLHTDDVEFYPQGMRVTLRDTKTRQDAGDVHIVEVRRIRDERVCPVVTLLRYIEMARLEPGYIYRGILKGDRLMEGQMCPDTIGRVVKAAAAWIGLPPAEFGSHSLRAGMVTAGSEAGVSAEQIMNVTDHRRFHTMLKYVRPERHFIHDTTGKVFA